MAEMMETEKPALTEVQQTFMGITGAGEIAARQHLEAAGGNLDLAVSLFFDGGGAATEMGPPRSQNVPIEPWGTAILPDGAMDLLGGHSGKPLWHDVIWGGAVAPPSWLEQDLAFQTGNPAPFSSVGFVQRKNGPCGVLAVINAVLVAQCRLKPGWGPTYQPTDVDIAQALAAILQTVAAGSGGVVQLCAWEGAVGGEVAINAVQIGPQLEQSLMQLLPSFKAPGGVLLLVYCCVVTRGAENIQSDVRGSGGEPPLIVAPYALCTSEIVALMLKGVADGNVSAYSPTGGAKISWHNGSAYALPIGMLSALEYPEFEGAAGGSHLPLADELKSPTTPVWIIHSSTHFTFAFCPSDSLDQQVLSDAPGEFELYHWNGLPPGGPVMTCLRVNASGGACKPAPAVHTEGVSQYYKPIVNHANGSEIDSVVQAHPADKAAAPRAWHTWRFEVVLATEDAAVEGNPRPAGMPLPQLFKLPATGPDPRAPWRCATCYATRFRTMNFGLNEAGTEVCSTCGQAPSLGGFSIWVPYSELPRGQQGIVSRRHAPKIISILHTKWPGATMQWRGNPPSV
uniref:Deubiquitinating enzyme MINDY-3/4 conserved domain-containing protein n=1 Tax=Phaeomonas parva TaxID=124430 RepID=A0A7S1TWT1_9STRA